MSARKTERLLNLLIMLLVQRHYVPKSRIRAILYADAGDEAFERMFDRDKDELRSLGVPIEVGQLDPLFDDEPGYRIRPDRFALPPIALEPDEASVVGLAARVWQHAKLAEATGEAVRKLTAAGVEVDLGALDIAEPRLTADEPAFDVFWDAALARREVVFDYRRGPAAEVRTRRLQPWGVVRSSGRWYAVGLDVDKGEERVFRLSRVVGAARAVGPAEAFVVPEGTDVRAVARRLTPSAPPERTVLLVRPGAGHSLRADAEPVAGGVLGPDGRDDWERIVLARGTLGLADEVLAHGPDVVVEEPAELRRRVRERLEAALAPATDGGSR